jgi:hypothetical protein
MTEELIFLYFSIKFCIDIYEYKCEPVLWAGNLQTVLEFLNNLWGARNLVGIGLWYWATRLHRLAELIPWNRFLGSLKV